MRRLPSAVITLGAAAVWLGLGSCSSSTEPRGAATLSATTSTALSGTVGTAVAPTPAVQVLGAGGAPVQGVTVTFAVTAGEGTVTNATVVTDAQGAATPGSWVLGPVTGTQTLTASAVGLTPVVFSALAQANACDTSSEIAVGETANGTLAAGDCVIAGAFTDNYTLTTTAGDAVEITMTSSQFDTFLEVANADGVPIAVNDDTHSETTDSRIKLLAAAGMHTVAATSFDPGETGSYTLQAAATTESVEDCDLVFIERGVTTEQTLSESDCLLEPPYFDDEFFIYLAAGSQVRITQASTEIDPYLLLLNPDGTIAVENDDASDETTDAQIVYAADVAGFYLISASSSFREETGAYTLTVDLPASAFMAPPSATVPTPGAARIGGRKAERNAR